MATQPMRFEPAGQEGTWRRHLFWGSVILVLTMMISLPTVMIIGVGMLPTIVAGLIDRSDQKFSMFCVGGLNFAGVFPYLMQVWSEDHSIANAGSILTDLFTLTIMFSSAGFGWMLVIAVPPVITAFLAVLDKTKLKQLKAQQQGIVEEWGDSAATTEVADETKEREDQPAGAFRDPVPEAG